MMCPRSLMDRAPASGAGRGSSNLPGDTIAIVLQYQSFIKEVFVEILFKDLWLQG